MDIPVGFEDVVKWTVKEPVEKINGQNIWDKFVQVALIGGGRSEADTNVLLGYFKKDGLLKLEKVNKLTGDDLSKEIEKILKKKMEKMEEEDKVFINNLLKELFRITASIKGLGRFFDRRKVIQDIDKLTKDDATTAEFIDEIAEDEDVSNVRQTKVIIWLHSIGRGKSAIPATRQIKSFVNNEIGPYYQYYEDDKYFIKKTEELVDEMKKKNKDLSAYDVTRAIFFFIALKSMVPRGLGKSFTCVKFMDFTKKNKLTPKKVSEALGDVEKRYDLSEKVEKYSRSIKSFK
ncbi:MAG: hypothetical protein HY831_00375 [Candidatus Aenigmarchaeota archaeon]|nr:hypothetical protein [Candidatus Aenigmarchaeota archaeon]